MTMFARNLETIPLVEKLCTRCERSTVGSHTFRLPLAHQSATIPRCLIAAVRGPSFSVTPREATQGKEVGSAWRDPEVDRTKTSNIAFHKLFTPVEMTKGAFFCRDDYCDQPCA